MNQSISIDSLQRGNLATKGRADPMGACAYTILEPGESDAGLFVPGDVVLVRNLFAFSRTVQGLQRLRHGRFGWPSHAAIFDSPRGDLIEASRQGVIRTSIRNYGHLHRAYLHPGLISASWDASRALRFARRCADGHLSIDRRLYLLNALALLSGVQAEVRLRGVPTCAGFAAKAMEAGGLAVEKNPLYITPADLASFFLVSDRRLKPFVA